MIHNKGKLFLRLAALVTAVGLSLVLVANVALADGSTIIIKKETIPPGGTGFEFTHNMLYYDSPFYLDHGESKSFHQVIGGCTVTETEPRNTPGGYKLDKVECLDIYDPDWSNYEVASRAVTIQLADDQVVECTFTNKPWTPPVVGGYGIPVNKLELLAPWIGLAALASLATLTAVLVKRRSRA